MTFDKKLEELFIDLPEPPPDMGNSIGALQTGKLLYISGALPWSEGRLQHQGRVGVEVRPDNAKLAARLAAVFVLALARRELGGSLARIRRVIGLTGFVACGVDFRDHAKIIDGAGELFTQIFGSNGKHVRTVAGATSLPQNACVEISVVFELK
ncbi:MAG: RidA family protein [Pseudomonadota bacterium]